MAQAILATVIYLFIHAALGYLWYINAHRRGWTRIESLLAAITLILAQTVAGVYILGWLGVFSTFSIWLWQAAILLLLVWFNQSYILPFSEKIFTHLKPSEIAAVVGVILVAVGVISLSLISQDVSFDSLNYHLPWAAYLLQEGRLDFYSTSVPWINFYPKAIEAWQAWHLAFWHNTQFVQVSNLIFLFLGGTAVFGLVREFRLGRGAALLAAVTYIVVPLNILQLRTNYIDLATSALFLALLYWSLQKRPQSWWLWASTAGLMIGAKMTMSLLVFLALLIKLRQKVRQPRWGVVGVIIIILFFGSFFYWRNLVDFGSPIYPLGWISLHQLLDGSQSVLLQNKGFLEQMYINFFSFGNQYGYQMNPGGFGAIWILLLLPALIAYGILTWKKYNWRYHWTILALIIGFLLMPANWWLRYVIFVTAAGSLALAWIYEASRGWPRKMLLVYCVLMIAVSLYQARAAWQPTEIQSSWPELNGLTLVQASNTTLDYDSRWQIIFPLWNHSLSNRVIHVSAQDLSYEDWLTQLREQKVTYLVTKSPSPELSYIAGHPEQFKLVKDNNLVKYWELE